MKAGNPGVSILSPGLVIRVPVDASPRGNMRSSGMGYAYSPVPDAFIEARNTMANEWNDALFEGKGLIGFAAGRIGLGAKRVGDFFTTSDTERKAQEDLNRRNALIREGMSLQSANAAVTSGNRYQAQYDAWKAAQNGANMADFKRYEYDIANQPVIQPKPMTSTQNKIGSMQNNAQQQANYNAVYGGGPTALAEGGYTVKVNNVPYLTYPGLTNAAVNQYTGVTVPTSSTQQEKPKPKPLGANYVIYDPNGKIIYSAEQASQARYDANHPEPVDPTKYFGSVGQYTWKF